MTSPPAYVTLYEVAKASGYSTVSFIIRRNILDVFRQKHPHYGETSKVIRDLIEAYTEGRVVVTPRRVTKVA